MFQEDQVKVPDFQRALHIAEYSATISNLLIANTAGEQPHPPITPDNGSQSSSASRTPSTPRAVPMRRAARPGIPQPEAMTMEWAIAHRIKVAKLLSKEQTPLATISGNTMYPVVNNQKGGHLARDFVNGLVHLGLGKIVNGSFKRINPDDEECDNREDVRAKLRRLAISYEEE